MAASARLIHRIHRGQIDLAGPGRADAVRARMRFGSPLGALSRRTCGWPGATPR
jgi:hypothetical protein